MIFKIADGRECFYQWDIDRQLIVSDPTITEVHFCNRTDVCSLVVEVVDGVANVPNKLLQSGFDVRVFGYDGKATMHEATFKVKARTQPADYVYTETAVKSIEEILEAAETVTTTANEFYEFVEDHTLGLTDDGEGNVELVAVDCGVDLSEYYTKTEVNELIENIDIPETDLTGYATETYVDEAVKNVKVDESKFASKDHSHAYSSLTGKPVIPSIEGLASEEYVDEAVKNAKPDLTDYAKKTDIPDVSDFISEIPEEYITETELNNKGYATEKYVDDAIAAIDIPGGGGSGGSGKPLYQHTVYVGADGKTSGVRDPSAYATFVCDRAEGFTFESFVDYLNTTGATLAISGSIFGGSGSTSVYPLDLMTVNTSGTGLKVYYRTSTDGATPQFSTWNITSTELTNFTDTVSLIGTASVSGGGNVDLSNYYTKTEVDEAIANIDIPEGSSGGTSVTVGGEAQETWDADTKLDKLTSTGGNTVVAYTMRANGTQDKMVINTSSSSYLEHSNSIVAYRNSQIPLPNAPTQDYHAANKKYVDDAIQDALNAIGVAEGGAY